MPTFQATKTGKTNTLHSLLDPSSGSFYQNWTLIVIFAMLGIQWSGLLDTTIITDDYLNLLVAFLLSVIADRLSVIQYSDQRF